MERFSACVDLAFRRTKAILLPVRKTVWLKLFFLFLFSGGFVSFKGGGNFAKLFPQKDNKVVTNPVATTPKADFTSQSSTVPQRELARIIDSFKAIQEKGRPIWEKIRPYLYFIVAGVLIVWLMLTIFFTWLSSRLQMVLMRSLSDGGVHIRLLWHETRAQGQSLFVFNLKIFVLFFLLFAVPLIASAWGIYHAFKISSLNTGLISAAVLVLFLFLFIAAASVVWFFVRFVPVVMVQDSSFAGTAASKLWEWLKNNMWRATVDLFLYSVLALAIVLMMAIVSAIVAVVGVLIAIPAGLVLAYLIKGTVVKLIGLVVFVPIAIGFILILSVVNTVPVGVFLTYLRMEIMMRALSRTQQSSPHAEA